MQGSDSLAFPVYLLKGEMIQFDGKWYVIPEPVACESAKELVLFIYSKGLRPISKGTFGRGLNQLWTKPTGPTKDGKSSDDKSASTDGPLR